VDENLNQGAQKGDATLFPWGLFRDRRPDLYGALLIADGTTPIR